MMIFYCSLLIVAVWATTVARAEDFSLEPEELEAIRERLANYEAIGKAIKSLHFQEENREDKCLPEGSECTFGKGLNCCGMSTRCIWMDTQLPALKKGGSARWIPKCRKYKAGVAVESVVEFFKEMGK